jgi:hypothetical protein
LLEERGYLERKGSQLLEVLERKGYLERGYLERKGSQLLEVLERKG